MRLLEIGSALVNRVTQAVFEPQPFDAAGFNLHARPDGDRQRLVVLVHGLGGTGYGTWGELPERLFNGSDGPPIDLGVYEYRSALRRRRWSDPNLRFWRDQLHGHLRDVERDYSSVFLVGHSLGGVLVEAVAKEYLQNRSRENDGRSMPLAALIEVAAPRAGSGWAVPALGRLLPETRVLRRLSTHSAEIDEFFSTHVERQNVASAAQGRTVLPVYVALGGRDLLVNEFSAAFGVPTWQRKRLTATHSSVAKPHAYDAELVRWLHRVVAERLEVREQAARERLHAARRSPAPVSPIRPFVVTQFWSDPAGTQWEVLYNEVRRAATTADLAVHDARDVPDADVDLLIAVHDAELVLASPSNVEVTVRKVCVEREQHPRLSVGISPVGGSFQAAETTVRSWVGQLTSEPSVYVAGAADAIALRGVLGRWLLLVIGRDPRRSAEAEPGALARQNPYDSSGGGDYS